MQPNPFSTRFIRPGAITYKFFDDGNVSALTQRFLKLPSKRGLIIGPHGSGKSTLIASLVSELSNVLPESKIHQLRFSTDCPARRSLFANIHQWTHSSIVVLDGYEQLKFWSRFLVIRVARTRSISILATAHQPIRGFDTIWKTSVSKASSQWVVEQLLQQERLAMSAEELFQSNAWTESRAKHGQNLRESLFDMYDWWQGSASRRSSP